MSDVTRSAVLSGDVYKDVWQAGKSVAGVDAIEPAGEIVRRFARAAASAGAKAS